MKLLFIYPQYPDTYWSFKHVLKFISKKANYPPLGLLTVASMLPPEWETRLVDTNISELKDEQIAWADLIFIGAMIVQKASAQEIITRCKALGKTVVAGGPVFTTSHQQFVGVDHFVLNEAEITLPLFLEDLKNGNPKPIYSSDERPDIKNTPLPKWSLINLKNYATMLVQYSRGCPFNCEFCDIIIMNGRFPRTKTSGQILGEFQALYDAGWRGALFVVDDNFIGNKKSVKQMLPLLIEWQKQHKYPFKLMTEASTNLADDEELMEMMSAANFDNVFLGIETPNLDSLKECGKLQNVSRNLAETVKTINRHGMQVMGGFIVGFDSDTESIFETQIRFIQEVGIVAALVNLLHVLPQTQLWHRLKAEGRLLGDASSDTDGTVNFVPKMDKELLVSGYQKILSTIYSQGQYYRRIETFIRNYRPTVKSRLTILDLRAGLESMWSIGILSKARLLYWKLLIKTAFTKIRALPNAFTLAIYGLHFEIITRQALKGH